MLSTDGHVVSGSLFISTGAVTPRFLLDLAAPNRDNRRPELASPRFRGAVVIALARHRAPPARMPGVAVTLDPRGARGNSSARVAGRPRVDRPHSGPIIALASASPAARRAAALIP